jgi:hypothetical protein
MSIWRPPRDEDEDVPTPDPAVEALDEESDESVGAQTSAPAIVTDRELTDLLRKTYSDMREKMTKAYTPLLGGPGGFRTAPFPATPMPPLEESLWPMPKWDLSALKYTLETTRLAAGGRPLKWGGKMAHFDTTVRGHHPAPDETPKSEFYRNPFISDGRIDDTETP